MYKNILLLGPKCSGKTTLIYTLLKKITQPNITIGVELYTKELYINNEEVKLCLWDAGNGLYYMDMIQSILNASSKLKTIMIIINKEDIEFINNVLVFIKKYNYNIRNIFVILNNMCELNSELKKKINKTEINLKYFNIKCEIESDVNKVINYIKENINII